MDNEQFERLRDEIIAGVVSGTVTGLGDVLDKLQANGTKATRRFYNKKEMCEKIGISRPELEKWVKAGLTVNLVDGRMYMIDIQDVVDFVKKYKVNTSELKNR